MGPPKNREQFGKMDDCALRFKCNGRWAREQVGRGWELEMGAWFFEWRAAAGRCRSLKKGAWPARCRRYRWTCPLRWRISVRRFVGGPAVLDPYDVMRFGLVSWDEVAATILGVAGFGGFGAEGFLFTVANGVEVAGWNAQTDQILFHGVGAAIA
jgi:hypothetical protein